MIGCCALVWAAVSRRFDCRRFKVRISPSAKALSSTAYDFSGIKPAFCSPVEVFSKRKQHSLDGTGKAKRSKHASKQDMEKLEAKLQARVMELRDLVEANVGLRREPCLIDLCMHSLCIVFSYFLFQQHKINSLISKANDHIDETVESRSLDHLTRAVELRNNGLPTSINSSASSHASPVTGRVVQWREGVCRIKLSHYYHTRRSQHHG